MPANTELLLLQVHLEVNPVHPQVDEVQTRKDPASERFGFVLPLGGQPGDRAADRPDPEPNNCSRADPKSLVAFPILLPA